MRFAVLPRLVLGLGIGLGVGIPLAIAAMLSGALGPAETTANGGGTVTACVSFFTGDVRMGYPGQSLTCSASEFPVELGAGHPADSLTYTVRKEGFPTENLFEWGALVVECEPGEVAISGSIMHHDGDGSSGSVPIFEEGFHPLGDRPLLLDAVPESLAVQLASDGSPAE